MCAREIVCDEGGGDCSDDRTARFGIATRSTSFASLLRPTIKYIDSNEYVWEDGSFRWLDIKPELDMDADKVVVRFTGVGEFFARQASLGSVDVLSGVTLTIEAEGQQFPLEACTHGAGCLRGVFSSDVDEQTGHVHMTLVFDAREVGASRLDKAWKVTWTNNSGESFVMRRLTVEFAPAIEE